MNVKISLFGLTGAGKTSFLLALRKQMSKGLKDNRRLHFMVKDDELDLQLESMWMDLCRKNGNPESTSAEMDIAFACDYDYVPIADFEWKDYPGEYIIKKEFTDLVEAAKMSDCLLFMLPTDLIFDPKCARDYEIMKEKVNRAMSKLRNYCNEAGKVLPVVFAVNKLDKEFPDYPREDRERKFLGALASIKAQFPTFFENGTGWWTMVCGMTIGDLECRRIEPCNIHVPMLFAIRNYMQLLREDEKHQLETLTQELNDLTKQLALNLKRFFPSASLAKELKGKIESTQDAKKRLEAKIGIGEENAKLLRDEICKSDYVNVYYDGVLKNGKERPQ